MRVFPVNRAIGGAGSRYRFIVMALAFGLVGSAGIILINALSNGESHIEPESGSISGCAQAVSSPAASGGAAVKFQSCPVSPTGSYGAKLPIQYNLSSLTGTIRYASTNGSGSANTCPVEAPCSFSRALSLSANNDTIVLRGGTYRGIVNATISKAGLRIIAYPGEIPVFNGAVSVAPSSANNSGWNTESSLRWRDYIPRPINDGSGIPFSTGSTNLSGDGVGRYPDQAWIGATRLKQVLNKDQIADGKFWVDRTSNRLYMTATDAAKQDIEISRPSPAGSTNDRDRSLYVLATSVKIEGLKITRYSNSPNDYGVIVYEKGSHNPLLKNVEISDASFITLFVGPVDNALIENVTLDNANWMGLSAFQTDNLYMKAVKITNMNKTGEFTSSPMSGALKTSRTRDTKVENSYIANNNSHGLWYDESNINAIIANSVIVDNASSGVFYEISDGLTLVNNYIRSSGDREPVILAGSGGLRIVNNIIVGGANPIGLYTDDRSKPNCSNALYPFSVCHEGGESSVLLGNRMGIQRNDGQAPTRFERPTELDWMPRMDLMLNNILAYPTASRFCGITVVCVTTSHSVSKASVPLQNIFHQANNPWPNLPKTLVNGNVYATNNANGILIRADNISYTSLGAFRDAMSASPVGISGFETNGLQGTQYVNPKGSPTASLTAKNSEAVSVPADATINQYIPAGTRRYGTTFDVTLF